MSEPEWQPHWYPPPRSTITGHRFSRVRGHQPVQTRDYPWWPWWPLELLSRIAARKVGSSKLSERLIRGEEPDKETDNGA